MLVGVPKEIKDHEYRVGLLPSGVKELTRYGHKVLIESHAGAAIGFNNESYLDAGATIVNIAEHIFAEADLVISVNFININFKTPGDIVSTIDSPKP